MKSDIGQCNICKKGHTSTHVEVEPGVMVYVCPECIEKAKENIVTIKKHFGGSDTYEYA